MRNPFKKPPKTTAAAFLLLMSSTFIAGCGGVAQKENQLDNNGTADSKVPDNKITPNLASADGTAATQVILDPHKCVGCGKCVRVAPSNFQMNSEDKAVVTSQQNADGAAVQEAQKICPGDAITIVKA